MDCCGTFPQSNSGTQKMGNNINYWIILIPVLSIGLFIFNTAVRAIGSQGGTDAASIKQYGYPALLKMLVWLIAIAVATSPLWFPLEGGKGGLVCAGESCARHLSEHEEILVLWVMYGAFTVFAIVGAIMTGTYKVIVNDDSILIGYFWPSKKINFNNIRKVYFRDGSKGSRVLVIVSNINKEATVPGSIQNIEKLASYLRDHVGSEIVGTGSTLIRNKVEGSLGEHDEG